MSLTLNTLLFLRQNALYAVLSRFAIYETEVSEIVFAARGFSIKFETTPSTLSHAPRVVGPIVRSINILAVFCSMLATLHVQKSIAAAQVLLRREYRSLGYHSMPL